MRLDHVLDQSGSRYPWVALAISVAVCGGATTMASMYLLMAMGVPSNLGPAVETSVGVGFMVAAAYFTWNTYIDALPVSEGLADGAHRGLTHPAWAAADRLPGRVGRHVIIAATLATVVGSALLAVAPNPPPLELFAKGALAAVLGIALECATLVPMMRAAMTPVQARLREMDPSVDGAQPRRHVSDTAIRLDGLAGLLERTAAELDDELDGYVEIKVLADIRNAARQASKLTDDLMVVTGAAPFRPTVVHLPALIASTVETVRRAESSGLRFACRYGHLPPILGDDEQLGRAIAHLAENACLACKTQRGQVTVSTLARVLTRHELAAMWNGECVAPGAFVGLDVRDNGCGMTPDEAARANVPLFTGFHPARSGMGLAVVLAVARRHGGAVLLESTLGRGTRVQLWLPAGGPLLGTVNDPRGGSEPA